MALSISHLDADCQHIGENHTLMPDFVRIDDAACRADHRIHPAREPQNKRWTAEWARELARIPVTAYNASD